jgi:hypothetical protein
VLTVQTRRVVVDLREVSFADALQVVLWARGALPPERHDRRFHRPPCGEPLDRGGGPARSGDRRHVLLEHDASAHAARSAAAPTDERLTDPTWAATDAAFLALELPRVARRPH